MASQPPRSENDSERTSALKCDASKIPESFRFPYEPYSIQQDFMRKLYEVLNDGKLGIFESPTGTGKSLSIICATLTWLHNYEASKRQELEKAIEEVEKSENTENTQQINDSDWFAALLARKMVSNKLLALKLEYGKYEKLDCKIKEIRERKSKTETVLRAKDAFNELYEGFKAVQKALAKEINDSRDEEFLLQDYTSGDENASSSSDNDDDEEEEMQSRITKVYFCSRTHSQLSQFAKEVKKSPYANNIRLVSLGSRQNFCINDNVQKLNSLNMMNDRCRELQKNKGKETKVSINGEVLKKKKSTAGCPFYRQTRIQNLSESTLADVKDIEELVKMGRNIGACPYYGSRHAQRLAQLVLLPYNTLLHKQTREASGICLKGNVVIIDEAHNLLDAISSVHSSQVNGIQLSGALSQLSQYKDRYSTRLAAKNVLYIQQIVFILKALLRFLRGVSGSVSDGPPNISSQETVKILTLNEFVLQLSIDNINLFKILQYCQKSEIAIKLLGFSTVYQPTVKKTDSSVAAVGRSSVSKFLAKLSTNQSKQVDAPHLDETEDRPRIATSHLMQVVEFLRCLTNDDRDGKIVMNQHLTLEKSSFKYYLINPASHFREIVSDAKAVIVAGGTMQPMQEFSERLFEAAGAEKKRIVHFSCGHVIPSSHLLAISLSQGPSGLDLDFVYQNRNSVGLIDELGRILTNICNIIPGGIVCFFPSYDYKIQVLSQWENNDVLNKIDKKKRVFKEPRKANETSKVLADYSKCILQSNRATANGAILFCVVGGKMSEGINFGDDLGRCVVMVGMPYPNIRSPELQEKMAYLNSTASNSDDCRSPGQVYYENLCMKAVNQSIGRTIRHKDDYATILLLDVRYSKPSVTRGLPGWIRSHLRTCSKFGPAFGFIRKFFNEKTSL